MREAASAGRGEIDDRDSSTLGETGAANTTDRMMSAGTPDQDEGKDAAKGGGQTAFCRVCLEEDVKENFCQPCSCTGSMSHAHPSCIQHWINEKGDMLCEICKQPYSGNFEQPPPPQTTRRHGFMISPDVPEVGALHRRAYEEDYEDRMAPVYGITIVMVFTILLFAHHLMEAFTGPRYQEGGPAKPPAARGAESDKGSLVVAWGPATSSDDWDLMAEPWESAAAASAAPGELEPSDYREGEIVSIWIILAGLSVRFLLIMIPALLAFRLLMMLREAEDRHEAERSHAAQLDNMEAGAAEPGTHPRPASPAAAAATSAPDSGTQQVRLEQARGQSLEAGTQGGADHLHQRALSADLDDHSRSQARAVRHTSSL